MAGKTLKIAGRRAAVALLFGAALTPALAQAQMWRGDRSEGVQPAGERGERPPRTEPRPADANPAPARNWTDARSASQPTQPARDWNRAAPRPADAGQQQPARNWTDAARQPDRQPGRQAPARNWTEADRGRDNRTDANRGTNRSWNDNRRDDNRRDDNRWNDNRRADNRGNDYRWNNNRGSDWNRGGYARSDNRRWDNRWRDNRRYDWQSYRRYNPSVFRLGNYYAPYRGYSYRRIGVGFFLDSLFFGSRYWISQPWDYRLPDVYGPYRWVRYYDDALLVDLYSGEVVDVIYNVFW